MKEFFSEIAEIPDNFKQWILDHGSNPVVWIGFLLIGLAVFTITYEILNKDK